MDEPRTWSRKEGFKERAFQTGDWIADKAAAPDDGKTSEWIELEAFEHSARLPNWFEKLILPYSHSNGFRLRNAVMAGDHSLSTCTIKPSALRRHHAECWPSAIRRMPPITPIFMVHSAFAATGDDLPRRSGRPQRELFPSLLRLARLRGTRSLVEGRIAGSAAPCCPEPPTNKE